MKHPKAQLVHDPYEVHPTCPLLWIVRIKANGPSCFYGYSKFGAYRMAVREYRKAVAKEVAAKLKETK